MSETSPPLAGSVPIVLTGAETTIDGIDTKTIVLMVDGTIAIDGLGEFRVNIIGIANQLIPEFCLVADS